MIRFIYIGEQLYLTPNDHKDFAFWDTIPDKFVCIDGEYIFDSIADFDEHAKGFLSDEDYNRLRGLINDDKVYIKTKED